MAHTHATELFYWADWYTKKNLNSVVSFGLKNLCVWIIFIGRAYVVYKGRQFIFFVGVFMSFVWYVPDAIYTHTPTDKIFMSFSNVKGRFKRYLPVCCMYTPHTCVTCHQ